MLPACLAKETFDTVFSVCHDAICAALLALAEPTLVEFSLLGHACCSHVGNRPLGRGLALGLTLLAAIMSEIEGEVFLVNIPPASVGHDICFSRRRTLGTRRVKLCLVVPNTKSRFWQKTNLNFEAHPLPGLMAAPEIFSKLVFNCCGRLRWR